MNAFRIMTICFWCGWIASSGLHMFIQDWLGLEGYITFAREHWVHMSYMWGAIMFAGSIMFYYHKRREVAAHLTAWSAEEKNRDKQG